MNRYRIIPRLFLPALWLAGCGQQTPTLHIFNWADYIKPALVERFEREHGCRVVIDTFESNESMYNKLKAGATGYDLIFPSSYMVELMAAQGMLRQLDHSLLPNLVHIDQAMMVYATDPLCTYSVPYMMSNAGIAYRADKLGTIEATWAVFDRADLKGRMTLLNDYRETIGAALKFLGYSLNTTNDAELAQARDVVIRWKKNIAKLESEQYKNGIASGEFLLVHGYNGDLMQVISENTNVVYVTPKEGVSISCDHMVIPATAREVKLAHAFINFMLDPQVAAENTAFVHFLCPNKTAYQYLSDELRNDPAIFLPQDILAKSEVIKYLGPADAKYRVMWDAIKAAE
ncbi:MAG: spermidine/putrescine ABC transporter substrate-binding protein [bacterium]|nr:spermidine/putrescine ABC transporter substrate-binding protein [bacterium]